MVAKGCTHVSRVLLIIVLQLLIGCAPSQSTSIGAVTSHDPPLFIDDGDRDSLLAGARIHRRYLQKLPASHHTTIDGVRYSRSRLLDSLNAFIDLLEQDLSPEQFSDRLASDFKVIRAAGRKESKGQMLVTGYYEPIFAASLSRQGPYQYPVYRMPSPSGSGKTKTPSLTRAEIEGGSQPLAGSELAYLKDPFEVFLLHIQGSGRLELPDGSVRALRFAGHNGHAYRSIGKLLVREKKMTLKQSSIPAIRRYLDSHPEDLQRVLNHNPRYIFFAWGDNGSPRGSLGQPLTPGRSIAVDRKALPDTLFGWLETVAPVVDDQGRIVDWQPYRRFVLPQDSGAAIKGTGRVDLFWGHGPYAATAAGSMRAEGTLYFFVKR